MRILQGGAPKCGNFWLYKILQEILKASGKHPTSYIQKQPIFQLARQWDLNYPEQAEIDVLDITDLQCSYRISSIYRMPIDSLEEYFEQTDHVWTHSPICKRSEEVFTHFDKKVYIIRDPRDRAISASKYYCSDYMLKYFPQEIKDPDIFLKERFDKLMKDWVWHVFDHLRLSSKENIHIVFYENFLNDFQAELSRLLNYLEIPLNQEEKEQLEKAVSFGSLKKDNPKHLRKGKSGYWKEKLSDSQKERAKIIATPLLELLGYTGKSRKEISLPNLSAKEDFDRLKHRIITSQKPLYL